MEIDQAWDRVQIVIVSPEFTIKTASYTLQFCFSCPSIFHSKEVWKRDYAINPIPRGGGMEMGPCNQSHSKEVWKWDHAANPIPRGRGMEMGPCSQSHSKGGRYGNGTMQPVDPTTVLYTGMSSTFPNAPAPVRMCVKLNCF